MHQGYGTPSAKDKQLAMLDKATFIRCKTCGLTSHNPKDADQKYCGRCHRFHDDASGYELGPTFGSLPSGFSWIDNDGLSWHCPQTVTGHPQHQCDSCVRIVDDTIGPRTTTPEEITLMVAACRVFLTMEERSQLHRAISHYEREMIEMLMAHGGQIVGPEEWSQLILTCARVVLQKADEEETKP
jgi:ribosomal protein L37E